MALVWVLAVVLLGSLSREVSAQGLPRVVRIGTNPPGSAFHPIATGIAKVVTEGSPMEGRVQPYAGSSSFMPLLNSGEIELGIVTGSDAYYGYRGTVLYKRANPNVRAISAGTRLLIGQIVPANSGIRTVPDLKGKRVAGAFTGQLSAKIGTESALANGGLGWDDVTVVPVVTFIEGVQAVMDGRADSSTTAVGAGILQEADSRIGVRFLPLDPSPQGQARVKKVTPTRYVYSIPTEGTPGAPKGTPLLAEDVYLLGSARLSDNAAYAVAKALWEKNEDLQKLHPLLQTWSRDRMLSDTAQVPYHPGAVRFFKEKKLWTKEMEELQQKVLKEK